MPLKSLLVWTLVLVLASALECPLVSCGPFQRGECARKTGANSILLNTDPCPSGRFCSAQRMYEDWWWFSYTAVGDVYPCWDEESFEHVSYLEAVDNTQWPCYTRETNKDLLVGTHPKLCGSDHDCQLQDLSYSSCYCSLIPTSNTNFTYGICSPDISSKVFDTMWQQCGADGFIQTKAVGLYYSVFQRVYHLVSSTLGCAQELLWEFRILNQAEMAMTAVSSAGRLMVLMAVGLLSAI